MEKGVDAGVGRKKRWVIAGLIFLLLVLLVAGGYLYYWLQASSNQRLSEARANIKELEAKKQRPIVVFGDTRTNYSVHEKVVGEIYRANPEAVFHLGDAVNDGTRAEEWQAFNTIESKLIDNFNYYITGGNHDQESQLFYGNFTLPGNEKWYSVNYQGVHWVVIDSNLDLMPGSQQYAWLEADLAKKRDKVTHTAIIMHQSLYTSANHAADNVPYKQPLIDLFQRYGVDVVFSGHDHDYERSYDGKVYYLVCGSAGAPLYQKKYDNPNSQKFISSYNYCTVESDGNSLIVTAFNENSQKLDSVSINGR